MLNSHDQLEAQLRKSLLEKDILIKEIHHRVKNNMQIISSLLRLQSKDIVNPEYLMIIQESQNRIKSMALVHHHIYRSNDLENIHVAEYIKNLAEGIAQTYLHTENKIDIQIDIGNLYLNIDQGISIGLVINELITNSFKHAFPKSQGAIKIVFTEQILESTSEVWIEIVVSDNGMANPKTTNVLKTKSIGLQLIHDLVETQLRGSIVHECKHGNCCCKIKFRKDVDHEYSKNSDC